MARTSRELKDRDGIVALAMLARRREGALRAALARLTAAMHDAEAALAACEQACETRRQSWLNALSQGGVYDPREAGGASRAVEAQRLSLTDAKASHRRAQERAGQAREQVRQQQERLQDNARKQEKLRELLTLYHC
ncbi:MULTISPECIES: hypothetical protein [Pandoraea]|uniref:hypothetical protein n=1 Tax=Pandoraea TaxID=93217 RepID=UPI001F5CFB22|nr:MULTISPECIES: hypothetical protein [Pandoraea]